MICAVILAAGQSRRMGVQKLLLPLGGRPMIARIADEVLHSPVDQVLVVAGSDAVPIAEALAGRPIQFVANPEGGEMLDSLRCGLRALPEGCEAVLVVLGDQPGITAGLIAALVGVWPSVGRGIVVPTWGGRRGHPVLVSLRYRDEILSGYEETGLRGLLQAHPEDVFELAVSLPGVLEDVDRPEDYRAAATRFSSPPPQIS